MRAGKKKTISINQGTKNSGREFSEGKKRKNLLWTQIAVVGIDVQSQASDDFTARVKLGSWKKSAQVQFRYPMSVSTDL